MKIEWTAGDTYIIGKTKLNKTFKKVAGDIKWKDNKGELTIINPILEGGLEKGKITIDCTAEKINGDIQIDTCTIIIPKPTAEEAEADCKDEIETSFPTEWLDKYGTIEKDKAIKACIEYKRTTRPKLMQDYYEKYLEMTIEGAD